MIPSIEDMLASPLKHYSYNKTFTEAENDPIICCHTSGSTGAPKPIQLTNHYFAAYDNHRRIPQVVGRGRNVDYATFDTANCELYYNTFPPYHIAGIIAQGMIPILYNTTVLLGPIHKPPSGEICNEILKQKNIWSIYTSPTPLEQLLHEDGGLERAAKLDFIIFSGGPLAPSAGDKIAPVVDLGQYIGSTEIGIIPGILPSPDTWRFFEFHPVFGCKLEHITEDQYELVVPHDPSLDWVRPAPYRIAPDIWRTKDLFKQHPQKSYAYRFHGRADDIVVLGNGEKFNPVTMEAIVQGAPLLSGALIVGQGHFQAALIVEPKADTPTDSAQEELIDKIWPWVQKANADGPAHAQIFRSKILVTSPQKPFVRAGKGTVVRQKSTEAYEKEIEALYDDRIEEASTVQGLPELQPPFTVEKFQDFICAFLSNLLNWEVKPDDDIFVLGVDSLQTNQIVNGLKSRLHPQVSDISWVTPKAVYHNPDPASLAKFCYESVERGAATNGVQDDHIEERRAERMEAKVKKYTAGLPTRSTRGRKRKHSAVNGINGTSESSITVAITGSTGTLGTNLLQVLLEHAKIAKVYCLDRSSEAASRHAKSFESRGLSHLLNTSKVIFHKIAFGKSKFGLKNAEYKQLVDEVDVIIHNAWKVDFNHQLESFESEHIRSVRNFIVWARESERHPRIIFVSSLSSVSRWPLYHTGSVPETPIDDYRISQHMGYGESKHVAERILQEAAASANVRTSILRVGQIAGSTKPNGTVWNRAEWVPSLIQTSLSLGRVPEALPDHIDWIPVDKLAHIIVDIVHDAEHAPTPRIFNLVNPQRTKWESLLPTIQKRGTAESPLLPTSYDSWLKLLRKVDATDAKQLFDMPAAKIADFYESLQRSAEDSGGQLMCDTSNGTTVSQTMDTMEPVNEGLMEIWLNQWGF